jgi:hypothetical protein
MTTYHLTLAFESEDIDPTTDEAYVVADILSILRTMLPYMVDNVTVKEGTK